MEQAIQLFGYLVLTFLGFVVPIAGISLSMHQDGISKLSKQYKNEKKQTEEKIQKQIEKIDTANEEGIKELKKILATLERIKKAADGKIKNLNPKTQVLKLFIPLIFSFLGISISLSVTKYNPFFYIILFIGVLAFLYALKVLWDLLSIIMEVKKMIDDYKERSNTNLEQSVVSILEAIKKEKPEFLEKISVTLNGEDINNIIPDGIIIKSDQKQEFKIGFLNFEEQMARNVQIGFVFPTDFIIEKSAGYSIYTDETRQVVRYNSDYVHGWEQRFYAPLILTPLKEGLFKIVTFIKGENIKVIRKILNLKVEK